MEIVRVTMHFYCRLVNYNIEIEFEKMKFNKNVSAGSYLKGEIMFEANDTCASIYIRHGTLLVLFTTGVHLKCFFFLFRFPYRRNIEKPEKRIFVTKRVYYISVHSPCPLAVRSHDPLSYSCTEIIIDVCCNFMFTLDYSLRRSLFYAITRK